MQTFTQYLKEQGSDFVQQIQSDPTFKAKQHLGREVNELLSWIEQNPGAGVEEIQDRMLHFKNRLEDHHGEILNDIGNIKVRAAYEDQYKKIDILLAQFENPPADLSPLIAQVTQELASFYAFVQANVSAIR